MLPENNKAYHYNEKQIYSLLKSFHEFQNLPIFFSFYSFLKISFNLIRSELMPQHDHWQEPRWQLRWSSSNNNHFVSGSVHARWHFFAVGRWWVFADKNKEILFRYNLSELSMELKSEVQKCRYEFKNKFKNTYLYAYIYMYVYKSIVKY